MSRKHKRHGHGPHGQGPHDEHPEHTHGHGPHHELEPHDPKPPGEVVNPPSPAPGEDVDVRGIVRFAVFLLIAVIAASGIVFVFIRQLGRRSAALEPTAPPPPGQSRAVDDEYGQPVTHPDGDVRLQRHPFADMEERRAREDAAVGRYEWADRPAQVVRLPVEVAKRLVVQRGLPVRAQTPIATAVPATAPSSATVAATPVPRPTRAAPRPTRRPTATAAPAGEAPAPGGTE